MSPADIQILDDQFRARAEENTVDGYWFFLKNVLGYKDLDEHLHGDICEILAREDRHKYLFLLPRGHLKSSCVTIGYPMWRAIQRPERTFAIFNETEELPLEFMREIREHFEDNPILRKHWGHLIPSGGNRVWRSDALILNRDLISRTPTFGASSINKSTAGRHPDVMILDDVISDRTVASEEGLKKSLARFRELQALLEPPTPNDPVRGTMIVIGTRWHWQDLYSYIINNLHDRYLIMKRAAIEDGKVIFPQKFTHDVLDELRETMGEWVFSSQYMNEPVDTENATFTQSMIQQASWRGPKQRFIQENICNTFIAIDPAWEGHDCWGVIVGTHSQDNVRRIMAAHRLRGRPDTVIAKIVEIVQTWRPQRLVFEAIGGQEWLRRNLEDQLQLAQLPVPMIPITHENKAKDIRILSLVPEIQYGRLRIHESCVDLITELLQYPRSKYRDLMDATEMLCRTSTPPGLKSSRRLRHEKRGTGQWEIDQLTKKSGTKRLGAPWQT